MKTEIFKDYIEFLNRPDKKVNGVSEYHAFQHPNFEDDNLTNQGCWNCRRCSDCIDCRRCSDCIDCRCCSDCIDCRCCMRCSDCRCCSYCIDCRRCSDCIDCRCCMRCSDCRCCRDCSDCIDCRCCRDCSGNKQSEENKLNIPIIENIHQRILSAVTNEANVLDMGSWHGQDGNVCGTTHCRAGWVISLAGEEGKRLESETDTSFAAMQIYKKSSEIRVSPTRFYETNEIAMKDILRCAEEEKSK